MPAQVKKSGQTKINVYGGEELPLLLLEKQSCSEDFLSETILFAFIH